MTLNPAKTRLKKSLRNKFELTDKGKTILQQLRKYLNINANEITDQQFIEFIHKCKEKIPNPQSQKNNNNLARSHGRIWRPVAVNVDTYNNIGQTNTLVTEFIDALGNEVRVSGVSQCATEQYIVKQKQVADNDIFELSGLVLGDHQSIFVSSTAAVSFSLIGFEEVAETLS